jgi:GNAT superfamily N-acetyltransferase
MIEKIERYYLEINSIENLKNKSAPSENFTIKEANKNNFDLNKFFYKQIGKKHQWLDRLAWKDKNWIDYVSNKNLKTFILKNKDDCVGYFELIFDNNDCEIAYLGVLEEYIGKGYGGFLLSKALSIGFKNANRIWVHTCSLDHPNALENYKSRGMKIFKSEIFKRKAI